MITSQFLQIYDAKFKFEAFDERKKYGLNHIAMWA